MASNQQNTNMAQQPQSSGMDDNSVAAYLAYQSRNLPLANDTTISESELSLPVNLGTCEYCSRPAIFICAQCKSWYCTDYCRKKHWNVHKKNCIPRQLTFQDGVAVYANLPNTAPTTPNKRYERK